MDGIDQIILENNSYIIIFSTVNNRIPEKWKSLNDLKKKEVANEFLKELDEYLKQMREHQLVVSPPTKAEKGNKRENYK